MSPRNHNVPMSYYQNEEDDERDLYHTPESSNRRESSRRQDAFRTPDSFRIPHPSNPRYPSRMPVFSREPELERRSDHIHTAESYYEPREQRRQESWANEQRDGNRGSRQESYMTILDTLRPRLHVNRKLRTPTQLHNHLARIQVIKDGNDSIHTLHIVGIHS
jgi:hypothetical protein